MTLLEILTEVTAENHAAYVENARRCITRTIENVENLLEDANRQVAEQEERVKEAALLRMKQWYPDKEAYSTFTYPNGETETFETSTFSSIRRDIEWNSKPLSIAKNQASHYRYLLSYKKAGRAQEIIDQKVKEADDYYTSCVKNMPARLEKFSLNIDTLQTKVIGTDGWGIEMYLQDNDERVIYCRLVACALESEYQCPHYRFLTTERKIAK